MNNSQRGRGLVGTLQKQVTESEQGSFEVGEQRERNYRYYSLQPLGNEKKGRSHYISPDILDAVESKKSVFSETFLSAREVAKFVDCPYPGESESKTAYIDTVFKKNKHARLFRDAWHDAFLAKRCVFFVEWFPDEKTIELNFDGVPAPMVNMQLQQIDPISVDMSAASVQTMPSVSGPMQVVSGVIKATVPDGYVKISLIQPERFYRDPNATYPCESQWCTWQEDMSRGELIDLGFDEDQVMSLSIDYQWRSQEEDTARKAHDRSYTGVRRQSRVDTQEEISYFRTRTWLAYDDELFRDVELDFEPPEEVAMYEIHWSHNEILKRSNGMAAISIVEDMGIFEWSEMKISHAENGLCTADVVAHSQKTTSQLKRLIIDNQEMQNSSRNLVKLGVLKNPRDMIENKIGANLWVAEGSVAEAAMPLPTPELSQMTFSTLQMLKSDSEERSGMSGLAKGMNSDAVKYQNADNMIERLTTAGQRRVTMQARDFALTCLVPMCQYICKIAKQNDKSQSVTESKGMPLRVVPSAWREDDHEMDVRVALTPEENQGMAQRLLTLHQIMSQDPSMQMSYGTKQKHALFDSVFELMGITDTSSYMLSPSSQEYQQMQMQMQQQQAQMQQIQQAQMQQQQQFQMGLLQNNQKLQWEKFNWDRIDDMQDNMREDRKVDIDAEHKLAKARES